MKRDRLLQQDGQDLRYVGRTRSSVGSGEVVQLGSVGDEQIEQRGESLQRNVVHVQVVLCEEIAREKEIERCLIVLREFVDIGCACRLDHRRQDIVDAEFAGGVKARDGARSCADRARIDRAGVREKDVDRFEIGSKDGIEQRSLIVVINDIQIDLGSRKTNIGRQMCRRGRTLP